MNPRTGPGIARSVRRDAATLAPHVTVPEVRHSHARVSKPLGDRFANCAHTDGRARVVAGLILAALMMVACAPGQPSAVPPQFETSVDPEAWAIVPAGEFLFGEHNARVKLDYVYAMMVTDVTNAQYARYLSKAIVDGKVKISGTQAVGYYPGDPFIGRRHEQKIEAGDKLYGPIGDEDSRLVYGDQSVSVKPGYANHPIVAITWFGAKAYCDYFGWKLPTEIEWEKAARGTDGRAYPWGDEIAKNQANAYNSLDPFEKAVGAQGGTTPVGFYNGKTYDDYRTLDAPSPYGLYDMVGNVWQWTGDVYPGMHYRFMRGGSKGNYAYDLRVWSRNSAEPNYYGPSTGFRCVRK